MDKMYLHDLMEKMGSEATMEDAFALADVLKDAGINPGDVDGDEWPALLDKAAYAVSVARGEKPLLGHDGQPVTPPSHSVLANAQDRHEELLADAILEASEYLDPQHQGIHWPDPIDWDGRPLDEQGRDICGALDSREDDPKAERLSARIRSLIRRD